MYTVPEVSGFFGFFSYKCACVRACAHVCVCVCVCVRALAARKAGSKTGFTAGFGFEGGTHARKKKPLKFFLRGARVHELEMTYARVFSVKPHPVHY